MTVSLSGEASIRGFRDRDYLETREGLYFAVVGNVHPHDRAIAYLKYVPSKTGLWGSRSKRYDRVLKHYSMRDLARTFELLKSCHPEYMFHSAVLGLTFSAVPQTAIRRHLMPERRLAQLLRDGTKNALEKKVVKLARELSAMASIPVESFGVTGSVLMGTHREFSDIDLVVYGKSNGTKVRKALSSILKEDKGEIRRMRGQALEEFIRERVSLNNLTNQEAIELYKRKWNRGQAFGTCFSVHPVKLESEVPERYGDHRYASIGLTEVEATVTDSSDSMFMPAMYSVDSVKWRSGERVRDVREVVSYEGLYADIAREGERVRIKGKLEEVIVSGSEHLCQRIVIGSQDAMNADYLKPALNSI